MQGVVGCWGRSLEPSTCGSHPCEDGKCLGMLRSSGMGSGSFSFCAQLMPQQLWGRMVFPVSLY